jgi:hypothetical protein
MEHQTKKILVVDDDPDILDALRRLLNRPVSSKLNSVCCTAVEQDLRGFST